MPSDYQVAGSLMVATIIATLVVEIIVGMATLAIMVSLDMARERANAVADWLLSTFVRTAGIVIAFFNPAYVREPISGSSLDYTALGWSIFTFSLSVLLSLWVEEQQ